MDAAIAAVTSQLVVASQLVVVSQLVVASQLVMTDAAIVAVDLASVAARHH